MIAKSRSASCSDSELVGSSKTITRASRPGPGRPRRVAAPRRPGRGPSPRAGCRDARAGRAPRRRSGDARGGAGIPARTRSCPSRMLASTVRCGRQGQLLVDHRHAAASASPRAAGGVRLAVQRHRARVGPVGPAEDLHQRALARAVLADQRADLARADGERDAVERPGRAERLADAVHLQKRGRVAHVNVPPASRPPRGPASSRRCSTRWGRRSRRPAPDTA